MKKIGLISLIFALSLFSAIAQSTATKYYYCDGTINEIKISTTSLLVYFDKTKISHEDIMVLYNIQKEVLLNQQKRDSLFAFVVNVGNGNYEAAIATLKSKTYVVDVEPVIGENGRVLVSNRLYVQLKTLADTNILKSMAQQTMTKYDGALFVNNEYEFYLFGLSTNKTTYNTLELSEICGETGLFEEVEPGFIYSIWYNNPDRSNGIAPTDNYISNQWSITDLYGIWNEGLRGSGVKIALLDDGVDTSHYEFDSLSFTSVDGYYGYLTYPATIYGEHGTEMAGVIFSDHNNGDIAGIAPKANLLDISLFDTRFQDLYSNDILLDEYFLINVISSFFYALLDTADIILCPWDYVHYYEIEPSNSGVLRNAIEYVSLNGRNGKGSIIIFAAGNEDGETQSIKYPAYLYNDAIVVGASTYYHERYIGACYGSQLDIVAPGENIYTTKCNRGFNPSITQIGGTGIASAHVAGVVALMLSANPNLTRSQVDWILKHTTYKSPDYTFGTFANHPDGTWNEELGYGEINSARAIELSKYFSTTPNLVIKDTINDNGIELSPYMSIFNSPSIVAKDASNTNIVTTLEPGNSYKINVTVHNYSQSDIAVAPADVKLYYHTYMESFTGTDNLFWKSSFMYGSPLTPSGLTPVTIAGNGGSYTFVISLTLPEIYPVGAPGTKFYMGLAAIIDSDTSFIHNYSDSNIPFDLFVRENRLVAGKRYLHYQEPIGGIIGPIGPKSTISPNPTGGRAIVDVDIDEMPSDAMIVVSDMYGNIVMYDRMSSTSYRLNLEGKPSGSYYVCIVSGGGIMCMDKMVIN